jgi:hypothetical protein
MNTTDKLRVIYKHPSRSGKDDVGSALLLREVTLKGMSETKV